MSFVPWRQRTRLARERTTPVYRGLAWVVARAFCLLGTAEWSGSEHVPARGGALIVSNHISNADPLELGNYLISDAGRWAYFIGKSDIWKVPGLGWLARQCGQIPVERNTPNAKNVLQVAEAAIAEGKLVCIYPEGTITGDPGTWPMQPRTGAARIALETGCPVIPVAQWGAQQILPGKKLTYPRLWPRARFAVRAGAPVELDDLRAQPVTPQVLAEAGHRMTEAVTELLEQIRGERAPSDRLDLRTGQRLPRAVKQVV